MSKPMPPSELASAAGISVPYASQLLSPNPERQRTPSRPLAIHIFRATGWRHPSIASLTDEQIAMLEQIEPYEPAAERAA
ncbi:hypothetical protein [Sphingomonas baiyangensis]|uniref:XRE family transcriptional regulator n=1 Tax=Sphingomonas baiyangensis TaxID=2572576 RepID=A0A4U1L0E4_9SPHN|nr:hypothetical protein [Sphingomonas baiyangensis]TKD50197.1 hypothetical protein FBR43_05085 [Sphingomonas baiyangensis]